MSVRDRSATSHSDQALVSSCLAGDERAWRMLIERYKHLIYSFPRRCGAGPSDSADVFQLVCAELFVALPRLRDARCVAGWLSTVAADEALRWKRGYMKRASPEGDGLKSATVAGASANPPDDLEAAERQQAIREAIATLPSRDRKMLQMLFYSDPPVPYQTAAARLGLATGSIGLLRARCLKGLERALLLVGSTPGRSGTRRHPSGTQRRGTARADRREGCDAPGGRRTAAALLPQPTHARAVQVAPAGHNP